MKQRNQQQQRFSIKKTEGKGYGLFTCYTIEKGEFVIEYVGEMIRSEEVSKRIQEYKKEERKEQYILEMREHYDNVTIHTCIDATRYGNEARFVNHSCDANCSIQIVGIIVVSYKQIRSATYLPHLVLVANRKIEKGEELTFHYGGSEKPNNIVKCNCGSVNCCGYIPFSIYSCLSLITCCFTRNSKISFIQ